MSVAPIVKDSDDVGLWDDILDDEEKAALAELRVAGGPGSGRYPKGSGETILHGTAEASLKFILKDGIRSEHSGKVFPRRSEKGFVYLTQSEKEAQKFAVEAAHAAGRGSDDDRIAAVLEIHLPQSELGKLQQDVHDDTSRKARQFQGDIKPEWIKSVKIAVAGNTYNEVWKPVPLGPYRGAEQTEIFYLGLTLEEDPNV